MPAEPFLYPSLPPPLSSGKHVPPATISIAARRAAFVPCLIFSGLRKLKQ